MVDGGCLLSLSPLLRGSPDMVNLMHCYISRLMALAGDVSQTASPQAQAKSFLQSLLSRERRLGLALPFAYPALVSEAAGNKDLSQKAHISQA